ncbi:hypothetical protein TVNIR_0404 [Thioalkalivibrio nitratireducens DSM 14787]|uniref:Uncharacterized protein n=1 Tax=Thioalkalivibrio nitratireducens (strain DSM 14787 / UNIQEM 213 / ALEN2) TaxID=1255043 RepID=L0DR94_THIND|nr:hypothetical protein [Thioalkalivibrio nitratireducens]AGA32109.1 hypothetical protein TVNIR_0404 [Thioalkalivibrio nitratireducens DSM 14787]
MTTKTVTGRSCRRAASTFDWGNLISVSLAGVPLFLVSSEVGIATIIAAIMGIVPLIFWFGASMMVYAMCRHHPEERVGRFTQWAAYRYYGLMGSLIVVATFFPPDLNYYRAYWVVAAAILIPWTLYALYRIYQETWRDFEIEVPTEEHDR